MDMGISKKGKVMFPRIGNPFRALVIRCFDLHNILSDALCKSREEFQVTFTTVKCGGFEMSLYIITTYVDYGREMNFPLSGWEPIDRFTTSAIQNVKSVIL